MDINPFQRVLALSPRFIAGLPRFIVWYLSQGFRDLSQGFRDLSQGFRDLSCGIYRKAFIANILASERSLFSRHELLHQSPMPKQRSQ